MSRKVIALLLTAVMMFTMATACGSKQDVGQTTPENTQKVQEESSKNNDNASSEKSALPITTEPMTLSYWVSLDSGASAVVKDYGEIEAMKVKKEKTGIDIKWMHPPVGQESEQFNLMVTSSELPDVIEYNWGKYPGGPEKALQDGVIIRLNDLIDEYAPNLKKILTDDPEVKKQISTDNGDIYCFPYLYLDPELEGPFAGLQIRKDWLDKLGLNMPETIDDWYTVLKAFKEKDPNGNKESDEIPFEPGMDSAFRWLLPAWGITLQYSGWYRVNNEVKFAYLQPEYQEYLRTMAKWYKEGLIDPDFAITDAKGFDSKVTTNKVGSYYGYPGSRLGRYMTMMEGENPGIKLAGVPYPVLKAGEKPLVGQKNNMFSNFGAGITSANKHLAETVKWLDFNYGAEGHMLLEYGIAGKSYTMKDGLPVFTEEITKNPQGLSMSQAIAKYCMGSFGCARVHDFQSEKQQQARPEQVEALNAWFIEAKNRNMPPLTLNAEESQTYSNIINEITTFVEETSNKVIMGVKPIESFSFDEYYATLKKMGIEEAQKIQQAALDRYNKR